jgi:ubiquinone/menaquinone biosynthesis C-methylase UbiE
MIFLPGTDKQIKYFLKENNPEGKTILITGSGTAPIARKFAEMNPAGVQVIAENDYEIVDLRLALKELKIPAKLMDFKRTDYRDNTFDIIYSQAALSTSMRRKIFRELKRILKEEGVICTGEIVSLSEEAPQFMKDIWETSGIAPLTENQLEDFFRGEGFKIKDKTDLSYAMEEFYQNSRTKLSEFLITGSDEEKRYYKKLLNKISHESNVFLRLGGNKHMAFQCFILEKMNEKR